MYPLFKESFDSFFELEYDSKNIVEILKIVYKATLLLRSCIDNLKDRNTTWNNPFIEIQYPVVIDWNKFKTRHLDNKDKILSMVPDDNILKELCRNKDATYGFPISGKAGSRKFSIKLIVNFNSFITDISNKYAYFPIIIGLDFKYGHQPVRWRKNDKNEFWQIILETIQKDIPEEEFNRELNLPEPLIKAVNRKAALVKISLHSELQKFNKKPDQYYNSVVDSVSDQRVKEAVIKYEIQVIGIDNTQSQNRALFAIQKLLNETNYKGNIAGKRLNGHNSFSFDGYLPSLKFTPAQYLDAYGVTKYKTSRGKQEFSGEERRVALKALKDLHDKKYLLNYTRKYWITNEKGKKEERYDLIQTVRSLINVTKGYKALTRQEKIRIEQAKNDNDDELYEKLKVISVEPSPILVDQVDSYFILKPANLYQEATLALNSFGFSKPTKYAFAFLEWLIVEAELKRRNRTGNIIVIKPESLAYKLRLDKYWNNRQYRYVDNMFRNSLKTAKIMSYVLSYKFDGGDNGDCIEIELNPDKLQKRNQIDKEIEKIEN